MTRRTPMACQNSPGIRIEVSQVNPIRSTGLNLLVFSHDFWVRQNNGAARVSKRISEFFSLSIPITDRPRSVDSSPAPLPNIRLLPRAASFRFWPPAAPWRLRAGKRSNKMLPMKNGKSLSWRESSKSWSESRSTSRSNEYEVSRQKLFGGIGDLS
jgi:hypothetical protein